MIDLGGLSPMAEAGALIGAVLVEALVLYFGYGAAEELFGQPIVDRIKQN